MKVFLSPFTGPRSLCSICTSRGSRGEGIPPPPSQGHVALLDLYEPQELRWRYSYAPFTGPRSLCSTCTSRGSRGEGIPPSLHRAKSLSTSGIEPEADARARNAADRPGTSAVGLQAGQMDHVGDAQG